MAKAPEKNAVTDVRTVTSAEVRNLIKIAAVKRKRPIFLWGPPGIGKSELVADIGEEIGAWVIDLRMALLDPTDLRGIGYYNPTKNAMDWAAPVDLPTQDEASKYKYVILFLDEMNSAPPAVQSAAYQLILNRRIGQYVLPDNVVIIAAGNRETDKGVTYRMPAPLANRFVHFEMRVDFDSWLTWAVTHNVHSDVVGYLSSNKGDLFDFSPNSSSRSFATPRSWTFVSDILQETMSDKEVLDVISGTVGEGIAHKFNGHRKWSGQLPKAEDVCDGKVTKLAVSEISAQYTLVVNLCYELKERFEKGGNTPSVEWHKSVDNMIRFIMDCLSAELIIMGMRTAVMTYRLPISAQKLKNWDEFNKKYGKYILAASE
jgi:ATPase family associated with various cellular activities (AAA)